MKRLDDGVNLRLPSGSFLDWGNIDFDVNLIISDAPSEPNGQLFFDIFNTDGFLGDMPLVNLAYAPFFEVLPRKYRFRILNACMSRFFKLALAGPNGAAVPFKFIANDGNLVVNPITLTTLDHQGIAERYDIVVDFSQLPRSATRSGWSICCSMRDDGRGPEAGAHAGAGPRGRSRLIRASAQSWSSGSPARSRASMLRVYTYTAAGPDPSQRAGHIDPADSDRRAGAHKAGRVRTFGSGDSRNPRPVNARLIARKPRSSRGPSRSTARKRIP